jgi:hypothetical protein
MSGSGQRSQFRIEPFKHRVELDPQARGGGGGGAAHAQRADTPSCVVFFLCVPRTPAVC